MNKIILKNDSGKDIIIDEYKYSLYLLDLIKSLNHQHNLSNIPPAYDKTYTNRIVDIAEEELKQIFIRTNKNSQ